MTKENAILDQEEELNEYFTESFDFDELEKELQSQLEEDLSNLEFLKEEKEKIVLFYSLSLFINPTHSIWLVCGNISTACNFFKTYPFSENSLTSLANVEGLQEI